MKKIIVIRGPLGVGKSTIAKIVASKLNAEYLSLDKIISENGLDGKDGIPLENFLRSNQIILNMTTESTSELFVLDGCFYHMEQVTDLKKKFNDNVIFISIKCSVEKCIERDSKRGKVYGEDAARFVFDMTENVKVGHEVWNENLTANETIEKVMEYIVIDN